MKKFIFQFRHETTNEIVNRNATGKNKINSFMNLCNEDANDPNWNGRFVEQHKLLASFSVNMK